MSLFIRYHILEMLLEQLANNTESWQVVSIRFYKFSKNIGTAVYATVSVQFFTLGRQLILISWSQHYLTLVTVSWIAAAT